MNIDELWFFSNRLRGESHPRSKLTSEQVKQIRELAKQGFLQMLLLETSKLVHGTLKRL